jgi:drug/metabolite transporter (DMT)-like permease
MSALPRRHLSAAHRGILWMLLTMIMFVSVAAMVKQLALAYPVPQVLWARFFFHAVVTVLVFRSRLPHLLVTPRAGMQVLRATLFLVTSALFFTTLHVMPLAAASAIMFLVPILITALSVPILRESVGARRWLSVAVGFTGALLIIRPGADILAAAVVVPLAAALSQSFYELITRLTSRGDSPFTTAAYTPLVGVLVMSAVAPFFWTQPDLAGWTLMAFMGLVSFVSQFTLIKAYQAAPAAVVAPFYYTMLIWATALGFVLFDEVPDAATMLGALIVIGSGLYIFRGEQAPSRPGKKSP